MKYVLTLLVAALFALTSLKSPANAENHDFYKGKTIRFIVGLAPGGGFDLYTRLIARHFGKHVPGNPSVIVENVPGAGGLVALNKLYIAPPDGLQISLSQGTMAGIAQLSGDQAARFDLTKFSYLATVGAVRRVEALLLAGCGEHHAREQPGKAAGHTRDPGRSWR